METFGPTIAQLTEFGHILSYMSKYNRDLCLTKNVINPWENATSRVSTWLLLIEGQP